MKQQGSELRFAICIWNDGSEDLEIRKLYQVLPDAAASKDNYIRIIDESGEDYLYPATYFIPIKLPSAVERALSAAVSPVPA
jgi:hypothetical protein